MVEDRLQDLKSSTWGIFQIYFYQKLFDPDEDSEINGETKLTKKTVETLLNEIFTLVDKQNEIKMNEFANDFNISIMQTKIFIVNWNICNINKTFNIYFPSTVPLSFKIYFVSKKNEFQKFKPKMVK